MTWFVNYHIPIEMVEFNGWNNDLPLKYFPEIEMSICLTDKYKGIFMLILYVQIVEDNIIEKGIIDPADSNFWMNLLGKFVYNGGSNEILYPTGL